MHRSPYAACINISSSISQEPSTHCRIHGLALLRYEVAHVYGHPHIQPEKEKVKSNGYVFKENDLALLREENRQKLDPLWKGPYEIKKLKGSNAVIQEVGKRKNQEVHINRLKPYSSSLSTMQLRKWILAIKLCIGWRLLQGQTIEKIDSKTGIYFDEIGTVLFYPTRWKVVSYIDLEPTRELWKQTKIHQRKVTEFCSKIKDRNWYYYTDCSVFGQYMRSKSKYIDNLKDLVAEYLTGNNQNSNSRQKRDVLNFVGEISKILFGTLTQTDARNYNKQIIELEREQKECLHVSKEQMTIFKTTITSVNATMQKVEQNEKVLKGFYEMLNYSTHKFCELEEEIRNVNLINEQFRLIQRGVDESQHSFRTLIDAFVHAEQGTLQPQLITAKKIKNLLGNQKLPSCLDYPNFPFPELQKIITPSTYSYNKYLIYVLEILLFSPIEYHLYMLLPFAVVVKQEFIYSYIGFNKEIIFSDPFRQHFGKMTMNELTSCSQPNEFTFACKEEIPIYNYVP
jgi:hypothetical protein